MIRRDEDRWELCWSALPSSFILHPYCDSLWQQQHIVLMPSFLFNKPSNAVSINTLFVMIKCFNGTSPRWHFSAAWQICFNGLTEENRRHPFDPFLELLDICKAWYQYGCMSTTSARTGFFLWPYIYHKDAKYLAIITYRGRLSNFLFHNSPLLLLTWTTRRPHTSTYLQLKRA